MRTMNFPEYTQYSFWGNVEYPTNQEALRARNAYATELKKQGYRIVKSSLAGQMRKYDGIGQYNGTVGNVYYIEAYKRQDITVNNVVGDKEL